MSSDQTALLIDHIQKQAPSYYPGFVSEQVSVQLLDKQERASAILYRFQVSSQAQIHSLFVKVPIPNPPNGDPPGHVYEKPLLFPRTEPHDTPWLHYTALRTIQVHFDRLNKKQLGAIRVLDYLPQYQAVFMEESKDRRLRQLFFKKNRLYSPFVDDELTTVFQNVGIWLSAYHTMPKDDDVKVRHPHRDNYFEGIRLLAGFLGRTLGDESFFREAASMIINKGWEILPASLPLGLGHGDYALRNILIGQNARVTVLDTLAKWRTPIYEDIGYFLNELKMSFPQILSHGLAFRSDQLARYERAFLKGYFEDRPVPYPAIRLYEMLALLDKWSSTITKCYQRPDSIKGVARLKIMLINPYFRRRMKSLLAEILTSQLVTSVPQSVQQGEEII